jgi:hypothetical protein
MNWMIYLDSLKTFVSSNYAPAQTFEITALPLQTYKIEIYIVLNIFVNAFRRFLSDRYGVLGRGMKSHCQRLSRDTTYSKC